MDYPILLESRDSSQSLFSFSSQRGVLGIFGREKSEKLGLDRRVVDVVGEVGPFVGILAMVVKFFAAVCIANVAPMIFSDGMISSFKGRERMVWPRGAWVAEKRDQRRRLEIRSRRQAGQLDHRGVHGH